MTLIIGQTKLVTPNYAALVLAEPSTVSYYRFNEASGSFIDAKGVANITGGSGYSYQQTGATGDGNKAIANGVSSSRANTSLPSGSGARSFMMFHKSTNGSKNVVFRYGNPGTQRQWCAIGFNEDANNQIFWESWADDQKISANTFDNTYHHIAWTYVGGGSQVKVYRDGSFLGNLNFGGVFNTVISETPAFQCGSGTTIDEFSIHNAALSASFISSVWAARALP